MIKGVSVVLSIDEVHTEQLDVTSHGCEGGPAIEGIPPGDPASVRPVLLSADNSVNRPASIPVERLFNQPIHYGQKGTTTTDVPADSIPGDSTPGEQKESETHPAHNWMIGTEGWAESRSPSQSP